MELPLYFLPEKIKIPFSSDQLYQALRGIIFYDWAQSGITIPPGKIKINKPLKAGVTGLFLTPAGFYLCVPKLPTLAAEPFRWKPHARLFKRQR